MLIVHNVGNKGTTVFACINITTLCCINLLYKVSFILSNTDSEGIHDQCIVSTMSYK